MSILTLLSLLFSRQISLSIYLSILLSIYLSFCPSFYLSIYFSIYLHVCLSIYLHICVSSGHVCRFFLHVCCNFKRFLNFLSHFFLSWKLYNEISLILIAEYDYPMNTLLIFFLILFLDISDLKFSDGDGPNLCRVKK